jgi:hypothetical protein
MSETNNVAFVDENSPHDRLLNALAVIVLVSLSALGIYWQFLPLPSVVAESDSDNKAEPIPVRVEYSPHSAFPWADNAPPP